MYERGIYFIQVQYKTAYYFIQELLKEPYNQNLMEIEIMKNNILNMIGEFS